MDNFSGKYERHLAEGIAIRTENKFLVLKKETNIVSGCPEDSPNTQILSDPQN